MKGFAIGLALPLYMAACIEVGPPPVRIVMPQIELIDYLDDVAPILDRRCVVCHSCYNAPCQLQLGSFEGVARGGSKQPVYQSSRLTTQPPTRLFVDARTPEQWREKGFHSVIEGAADAPTMLYLLDAKRRQPKSAGEYRAEDDPSCPADAREVGRFLHRHPERGMPFGFPALARSEFVTLASWLAQGAPGPDADRQRTLTAPSAVGRAAIEEWEDFLNRSDPKHTVTARYLYEHYFLAHVHFAASDPNEFYRIVRSRTPPGEPVDEIATVRPYDATGVRPFYYRFQRIHSTIVIKTHIVVEFDADTLDRLNELFIETAWLETPHWVALGDEAGANPFLIYAQIPPGVRYRFLLDNAEYVMRTFIRGPVCKGQVALNVIRDQFWVMFLDPDADQTVLHPEFLVAQASNLRLPDEQGSDESVVRAFSNRYRDHYAAFYHAKVDLYDAVEPHGFGIDAIWKGRRPTDAPIQTVYRHFDSASVHKGTLGDLPRTLWVIDYSQFERIYYALVAGFDVFGNVSHQVNVRRYMDYLRIEAELNFLEFMPRDVRLEMLKSWYLGDRAVENVDHDQVRSNRPTRVVYRSDDPKREFVERVVVQHIPESMGIAFDPINYDVRAVPMPASFATREDVLDGFRALSAPGTGFIRHVTGSEANLLYVRIRNREASDGLFTIVINRWHDNVNSMFDESSHLDPARDTIDFIPGLIGAYPNYFLEVDADELPDFFDMLENFDGSEEYLAKIRKYGVNRADERFWDSYDWFQARADEADGLAAGRLDLNRYYPVAAAGTAR